MKETQVIAEGLTLVPEYRELLQRLRDKYNIPLLGPDTEVLPGLLGLDFDPEIVRQEIYTYVKEHPIFPTRLSNFLLKLRTVPPETSLKQFLIDTAELNPELSEVTVGDTLQNFFYTLTDPFTERIAETLFVRLITGRVDPLPDTWNGGVFPMRLFDVPTVSLIAGETSDIAALIKEFRKTYYDTFGRKKKKLTREKVEGAQYLRLELEGYKHRDTVDMYISMHQKEYDRIKDPEKRRAYRKRVSERIKKRIQRYLEYAEQFEDN